MRFSNHTTSCLLSLSQRIDHSNVPADGIAMFSHTNRTKTNVSAAVSANLAGPVNSLHASYLHDFQHGSSTEPALSGNSTNPHLTSDVLPTSSFAHVSEQHSLNAFGASGFTLVVSLHRYTRSTRAHVDPDHLNTMAVSVHQVPSPAPTGFKALYYNDNNETIMLDYYNITQPLLPSLHTAVALPVPCCRTPPMLSKPTRFLMIPLSTTGLLASTKPSSRPVTPLLPPLMRLSLVDCLSSAIHCQNRLAPASPHCRTIRRRRSIDTLVCQPRQPMLVNPLPAARQLWRPWLAALI